MRYGGVSSGPTVRPSETTAGAAWLGNFDAVDLPTATLLLDSLQFFSLSTMHARLKAFLEQLGNGGELKTPALVLPERSLNVEEFAIPNARRAAPIAYQDFNPGASLSVTQAAAVLSAVCFATSRELEPAIQVRHGSRPMRTLMSFVAGGAVRL